MVAAIGNGGDEPEYPAKYDGVIAVGATDQFDDAIENSTKGEHLLLCAPGDDIKSIMGNDEYSYDYNGTSFATAFVTSAVWLALRKKPCLNQKEIRDLLALSVDPTSKPTDGPTTDRGYGRLDMIELSKALELFPSCI
jgi:subtilisin